MTQAQQSEAQRLAAICETKGMFPVADELNRMHARILELEQGKCLHQIAEPAAPVVKPIKDAIDALVMAAFTEGGCSEHRMSEARIQTELRKKELRTLLSTPQPCSRSHPHEEMTPMCELRTEIARLTNALARAEAQLAAAPQAVQPAVPVDAEIDAAIQAFDWEGWADPKKAKRAFTREALARWAVPAHPAEGVPAQDMVSVKKEDANAFCRILTALGMEEEGDPVAEVQRLLAATQPSAQGLEQDAKRWGEVLRHVGAAPHFGGQHFTLNTLQAPVTALGFKANLMSGSVAQHFTKAIDAERAAQAKQGGAT